MARMKCQMDHFGFKSKEDHLAHVERRMENANSNNHRDYWRMLAAKIRGGY